MAGTAIPFDRVAQVHDGGNPLSGGKIYFYIPTTTTQRTPYTDSGLTVPTTNPVILNSNGWPETAIYLDSQLSYDYIIMSADDSETIWPRTTIPSAIDNAQPVDPTLTAVAALDIANGSTIIGTGTDTFRVGSTTEYTMLFATVAALKAFNTDLLVDGQMVRTQGYFAAGDGGGATYIYDTGGAGSGNDMTIIDATDAGGHFDLVPDANGVDLRQIGVLPNTRTLAQARLNARAIETWAGLANGIALTDAYSNSDDVIWVAPPAALSNSATVDQTGAIALFDGETLTINGSRTGAWIRQYDFQYCALFALYPGSDLKLNNCRLDQWSVDRDLVAISNFSTSITVTDSALAGTNSQSVTTNLLGTIHGFGGDYRAFNCEYTNTVYGDVTANARSRGSVMSSVRGYHHDTYSCLHSIGDVAREYLGTDADATLYEVVRWDDNEVNEIESEVVDVGGGAVELHVDRNWGKRCYTGTANPSHKEVFDLQSAKYYHVADNVFDLGTICGTFLRVKGSKNAHGVISGNTARNGLKNAVTVASLTDNGSSQLRVTTNEVHGGTTGETWAIMGAQTAGYAVKASITVISTTVFDMTSITYSTAETATRSDIRAVPMPVEYASSNTSDFTVMTGVAFSSTELQWNGTAGTIIAKQDDNTALGSFDLGDAESVNAAGSRQYILKFTVTDMTAGQLVVSIAGSGDYELPESSSDPITENGTYTMHLASNGVDEIAYVGTSSFDGHVEITDVSMVEWEGAFIVHANCENMVISDNVGSFFFDGLLSLDQGNQTNRDCTLADNRIAGILHDAIATVHQTNYADTVTLDKRLLYRGNAFRDICGSALSLERIIQSQFQGNSFHTITEGANELAFHHDCENLLLEGNKFHNGCTLTLDKENTDETIVFGDNEGFVSEVSGWYDGNTLSNGKVIISRTACTYTAVDAAEGAKIYNGQAHLYTGTWTAAGNNPFVIHQDAGNIGANSDIRLLVLDELGAVCNTKAVKFNWELKGPRKFPVA